MGYFDSLVEFKTDSEGEITFFPNSFWGKGYIIPNLEKKNEIQNYAKRIFRIYSLLLLMSIVGIAINMTFSSGVWKWVLNSFSILFLLVGGVWVNKSINKLTQGLVESKIKISIFESYTNNALSSSLTFLLFQEAICCLYIFGLFQITKSFSNIPWFIKAFIIFMTVVMGFGCIVFAYQILVKIRKIFQWNRA